MNEQLEKDQTSEENSAQVEENLAVDEEKEQVEEKSEEKSLAEENTEEEKQEEDDIGEEKEVASGLDQELLPEESTTATSSEVSVEGMKNTLSFLFDLELPVSIELARKEMLVRDVLQLGEGSLIEFDKAAGETVDLLINNKRIAEGEVVVIDDRFGIRISHLVDPGERLKNLEQ